MTSPHDPAPATTAGARVYTPTASRRTALEPEQMALSFASRTIDEVQEGLGDEPPVVFKLVREMMRVYAVAHFTVDGEPASKARARWDAKRGGRPYTPAATRQAQDKVGWLYRKAVGPHPTRADISFGVFAAFFCATNQRRDVDNMLKLVLDGLNKVAWADDSQVLEVSGRIVRNVPKDQARSEILVYKVPSYGPRTRRCKQCGGELPDYPSQRDSREFCKAACGYAWRKAQNTRTCGHCGRQFQAKASQEAKYCSKSCAYTAKHVHLACTQCGTEYHQARSLAANALPMCSTECRAAYWREHRAKKAEGTCEDCGGPTSKKTYRRCNACRIAAQATTS